MMRLQILGDPQLMAQLREVIAIFITMKRFKNNLINIFSHNQN